MSLTPEDEAAIEELQDYRNILRIEVQHRELSGRPYRFKDEPTDELLNAIQFVTNRIESILAPYEREL